jgi:hypothetical protein
MRIVAGIQQQQQKRAGRENELWYDDVVSDAGQAEQGELIGAMS